MEKAIKLSTLKRINITISLIPIIILLSFLFLNHLLFSAGEQSISSTHIISTLYVYFLNLLPSLLLIFLSTRMQKIETAIKLLTCSTINTVAAAYALLEIYKTIKTNPFTTFAFMLLPGLLLLGIAIVYFLTHIILKIIKYSTSQKT